MIEVGRGGRVGERRCAASHCGGEQAAHVPAGFEHHVFQRSGGGPGAFHEADAGGSGIFTGPDPDADKVVATGDALFDSTINSLSLKAINDPGNVVFGYTLANGKTGIVDMSALAGQDIGAR